MLWFFGREACGILQLPDQGSNPHPRQWKTQSKPLVRHGSPYYIIFNCSEICHYLSKDLEKNVIPFTAGIKMSNLSVKFLIRRTDVENKLTVIKGEGGGEG